MVRKQKGFTIIELVVVIVILGILAAVAFPKFSDMSGDAKTAVINGGAAALRSAAVITYAKAKGVTRTTAEVLAGLSSDGNLTFTGTCPGLITVAYAGGGGTNATVDISEYCSG